MDMETNSEASLPMLPVETDEFSANPSHFLDAARREHPWLAKFSQGYIVHGYQAMVDLLADDTNLAPGYGGMADYYDLRGTMWGRKFDEALISQTGPQHARLRSSVATAFTPRHANQMRPLMQRVIGELLDHWGPNGSFDFAEFASYFPVTVICGILGISADPIPRMRSALESQFTAFTLDLAAKPIFLAGWDVLWSFVNDLVQEREASGAYDEDSLLDALIAATRAGRLDETELRFMLIFILEAGYDTSKNMLTLTMHLLLARPELYARCAQDKVFCGRITEEALRHSGIGIPFRQVVTEFTYRNVCFRKGEMLVFPAMLAGRDPTVFPDPLTFDPERENAARHTAFGRGGHMCVGQFIARAQMQEGLHLIAQRLMNPRLNGEVVWRPVLGIWGLKTLPIAFELG
jgi:cytochrome P450